MTRLYFAGAAILATMALAAATSSRAQSGSEPIPGIDIIVRKDCSPNPPCPPLAISVNRDNTFAGQLKLSPGTYIVNTACSPRVRCPAHRLTSLMVNGRTVATAARGGVRVAVGDLNGDGREELTTFRGTISLGR